MGASTESGLRVPPPLAHENAGRPLDAVGFGPTFGGKLNGERMRIAAATESRVSGSPGAKVKPLGRFSIRAARGSGGSGPAKTPAKRRTRTVLMHGWVHWRKCVRNYTRAMANVIEGAERARTWSLLETMTLFGLRARVRVNVSPYKISRQAQASNNSERSYPSSTALFQSFANRILEYQLKNLDAGTLLIITEDSLVNDTA